MKILGKILNSILTIFIIILIIINIFILYTKLILKKSIIKVFGNSALLIISGSMEPELNIDDLIFIKEYSKYEEGDIVTFKSEENSIITHRIQKIEGDLIYTKGDSNNVGDRPIVLSQIQGKVIYKIDNFGIVSNFIKSPIGIAIIIAVNYLIFKLVNKKTNNEVQNTHYKSKH